MELDAIQDRVTVRDLHKGLNRAIHLLEMYAADTGLDGEHGHNAVLHVALEPE